MSPETPNGEAERLLSHPLIGEILDALEREALDAIVDTDDETRRAHRVWEVRAVRSLRRTLKALAAGEGPAGKRWRRNRGVA